MTTPSFRSRRVCAVLFFFSLIALVIFGTFFRGVSPRVFAASDRVATGTGLSGAGASDKKDKPYALIFGTVWGPDDHPIYGVTVKIRRAKDKRAKWQVYSDHHGEFAQRVPAGEMDYIVTADLKGVKTPDGQPLHLDKAVTVHVYDDEREDTGLHLTLN